MKRRKGKFTVPDLLGAGVFLFLLAAMWGVLEEAIQAAWTNANTPTKAVLVLILPSFLFLLATWIVVETGPEPQPRRAPQQVERRPRR